MSDVKRPPQSVAAMWARFEKACIPTSAPAHMPPLLHMAFVAGITSLFSELVNSDWSQESILSMERELIAMSDEAAGVTH